MKPNEPARTGKKKRVKANINKVVHNIIILKKKLAETDTLSHSYGTYM
jgi:hypothetical protein